MFTTVTVQLPTHTMLRLVEHLAQRGGTQDISESIATALELWLAANGAPTTAAAEAMRGYQWKTLFLPEGTVLRSWSYGEHNYACVEGDKIMHEGASVTPNQFARSFARTARNAWFDLSVRRPGDKHFKIASRLRQELAEEEKARVRSRLTLAAAGKPSAVAAAPTPVPEPVQVQVQVPATAPVPVTAAPTIAMTPAESAPAVAQVPQPAPEPRREKQDFDPGWDLPERRRFRYRAEDIAY